MVCPPYLGRYQQQRSLQLARNPGRDAAQHIGCNALCACAQHDQRAIGRARGLEDGGGNIFMVLDMTLDIHLRHVYCPLQSADLIAQSRQQRFIRFATGINVQNVDARL